MNSPRRRLQFFTIAALMGAMFVAVPHAQAAARCYVNPGSDMGLGDGSSWADAFTDLQTALANAACTEIWVAAEIYTPTSTTNRTISFQLTNGVALYGGFAGNEADLEKRDPASNMTILSGQIGAVTTADNSYHVVTGGGTNSTAVLDGFIITGGNASGVYPDSVGGGMYNSDGSPTLANVTFTENSGGNGGGMHNYWYSSPTLTDVTFSGNASTSSGGGMYNYSYSDPALTNVTFSSNAANSGYGGGGCTTPAATRR